MKTYLVTGTLHGSVVSAESEGEARRLFHRAWNGESIICLREAHGKWLQKPPYERD